MDAIDYWAAGRTRRSLAVMLRSRFALVVDQFRVAELTGGSAASIILNTCS